MTQLQSVLDHLQTRGSINCLEAIQRYGITRISARIFDLRRNGHCINSIDSKRADGFTEYIYNFEDSKIALAEEMRLELMDILSAHKNPEPQMLARICTQQANKALALTFIGR